MDTTIADSGAAADVGGLPDAGAEDAATDAGPGDILVDAATDAGPGDILEDATTDAGPPDAGPPEDTAEDVAAPSDVDTTGPVPPTPISEQGGWTFESETHVVIAPGGRTLALWMGLKASGVDNAWALSEDRGSTFGPPVKMQGVHSLGDPVATAGPDGSLYYGFLDGSCGIGGCSKGRVWVARMAPGEVTFGEPVDASPADLEEFYDKPWLMTGPDGSLILVFAARKGTYPDNVDHMVVARSPDGAAWTRTDAVPVRPKGQIAGIPHACVSRTGTRMWIVHVDSESPTWASIRWSDDLGVTWPEQNHSSGFALLAEANGLQSYDLRCAGEGDDVWVEYGVAASFGTDTSIPPLTKVSVAHSGDGGLTWDTRTTVNAPGLLALRPELILEPSGALDVIAYTGAQEGDAAGAVRWWRSTDGGESFEDRGPLFEPILFTGDRGSSVWIGDYSGLAFDGGDILTTFVDNASGASHILFARQPVEP